MLLQKITKPLFIASALAIGTLSMISSAGAEQSSITFPMSLWGTLKSGSVDVHSGALVEFKNSTGTVLASLTTTKDGRFGGDTAFDNNIALSEFNGALTIKVTSNSKSYTLTAANLTSVTDGCPTTNSITFVSKKCRYDINLNDANLYSSSSSSSSGGGSSSSSGGGSSSSSSSSSGGSGGGSAGGGSSSASNSSAGSSSGIGVYVRKFVNTIRNEIDKSTTVKDSFFVSISGTKTGDLFSYPLSGKNSKVKIVSANKGTPVITVTLIPGTKILATSDWDKVIAIPVEIKHSKLTKLKSFAFTVGDSSFKNKIELSSPASVEFYVGSRAKNGDRFAVYVNKNGVLTKTGVVSVKNGKITFSTKSLTNVVLLKTNKLR